MTTDNIWKRVVVLGLTVLMAGQPVPAIAQGMSAELQAAQPQLPQTRSDNEDQSATDESASQTATDQTSDDTALPTQGEQGTTDGRLSLKSGQTVNLCYKADGSLDKQATEAAILKAIVEQTPSETNDSAVIEYYAGKAVSGFNRVETWLPIDEKPNWTLTDKHTFGAGSQRIRVTIAGQSAETTVTFQDVPASGLQLAQNVSELPLAYKDGDTIDARATSQTILDQSITGWGLCDKSEATVEYCYDHINYTSLDYKPSKYNKLFKAFGEGEQWIRVTVPANDKHQAFKQEYKLTFKDVRQIPSLTFVRAPKLVMSFKDNGEADSAAMLTALKNDDILSGVKGCEKSEVTVEATFDAAGAHDVRYTVPATASHKALDQTVSVEFIDMRGSSDIKVNSNQTVALAYAASGDVDVQATMTAIKKAVLGEVVASDVTLDPQGALEPGVVNVHVSAPATKEHKAVDVTVAVTLKDARVQPQISFKQNSPWKGVFKGSAIDPAATEAYVRDELIDEGALAGVDKSEVKLEYCYFNLFGHAQRWASFTYSPTDVNFDGTGWISFGANKDLLIRATIAATDTHAGASVTKTVRFEDNRPASGIEFKTDATSADLAYNEQGALDIAQTKDKILAAIVQTYGACKPSDITIEYKAGLLWRPLDYVPGIGEKAFGAGEQQIRVTVAATANHQGEQQQFTLTFTDARKDATLAFIANPKVLYSPDIDQMKGQILGQLDTKSSTVPSSCDPKNFTFEYEAPMYLFGSQNNLNITKGWSPLEGSKDSIREYPRIGAGDQKIRVKFNGNAEYKPSGIVEASLKVNKGKIKIKVKNGNIFAGEKDSTEKVHALTTLNTTDNVDLYRIYSGLSSTVKSKLYLELPNSITDSRVVKILDPIAQSAFGAPLSQVIKGGKVSFGQVRTFIQGITNSPALNWLANFGLIDKGALNALNKTLVALKILDNAEVEFGVPRDAGLYTTFVVSNNPNYETAVGTGELLVRLNSKGTALTWNHNGTEGKKAGTFALSDVQQNADWYTATLSVDGDTTIEQSGVRYHFTGITQKGKLFSSSKAPTEPGRYQETVRTSGGNFFAWAKTRSLVISE